LHEHVYPFVLVDTIYTNYTNVRENGRVHSRAVLIATGVNEEGHRQMLFGKVAGRETCRTYLLIGQVIDSAVSIKGEFTQ
jgi:putative transposase